MYVVHAEEHKQRNDREHTLTQNKEIILQDYMVVMHVNKVNKDVFTD